MTSKKYPIVRATQKSDTSSTCMHQLPPSYKICVCVGGNGGWSNRPHLCDTGAVVSTTLLLSKRTDYFNHHIYTLDSIQGHCET